MKGRTYGRIDWTPKYLPDTMVEVDNRMLRYGDLDQRYEWIEVTDMKDRHPVFVIGMYWDDWSAKR